MRKKFTLCVSIAVMCGLALFGCRASKNAGKAIPYEVAERYFVRNDIKGLPPRTITSAEEFQRYFGMASVMGAGGRPTDIDFNKSFVICIATDPTDIDTDLSVISLSETDKGRLDLRYSVRRGDKMTYMTQPIMILVVSKKYEMPVVVDAVIK